MAEAAVLTLGQPPNPKQQAFFDSTAKYTCYGGARGGGKSWAARTLAILLALRHNGLKILFLRRAYAELLGNHIQPLKTTLAAIAVYVEQRKQFEFPNGSTLKMGYCDAEDDVLQYQGQEYDVIFMEEATQFTEYQFDSLRLCNRSVRRDFSPRMYLTCNPGGVGHEWVKRLFITREYKTGESPDDYCMIQARVYDNTVLMDTMPDYVRVLESLPEERRRAFLYGDWDVIEGQFFKDFRRDKHVVEPFAIPDWWTRFVSIDWGYNDPCCMLWHAVSPDGRVYTYREYYERERLAVDVAQTWQELSRGENIRYTVASPDMWQKRGAGLIIKADEVVGESIADTFESNGVLLTRADNSRVIGWQRIREYLADAPDGLPWWQCFESCKNLIRTLPVLPYDRHNAEDIDAHCEDHAAEALRYGLMSRPLVSSEPKLDEAKRAVFNPYSVPERRGSRGLIKL